MARRKPNPLQPHVEDENVVVVRIPANATPEEKRKARNVAAYIARKISYKHRNDYNYYRKRES